MDKLAAQQWRLLCSSNLPCGDGDLDIALGNRRRGRCCVVKVGQNPRSTDPGRLRADLNRGIY